MARDSSTAVIAAAKARLESLGSGVVGKVYSYIPGWIRPEQMDDCLIVPTNGSQPEHRMWWIENQVQREVLTNQSDLVTHQLTLTGWVAAKRDDGDYADSLAAAIDLREQVLDLFDQPEVAFPSLAGSTPGWYEDDGPQEDAPMEFRELQGVVFHVMQIRVAPREEVTRS